MSTVIKAPGDFSEAVLEMSSVFLAGSIEMGEAEDWQSTVQDGIEDMDVAVLNPRRSDWDSSWEQTKDNPQFREQVEWELAAQEAADCIAMYFDPETKSPITLLELGLFDDPSRLVVCCPEGFWRKGNVDIVCERYGIPMVETLDELIGAIRDNLGTEWQPVVEARLVTIDELKAMNREAQQISHLYHGGTEKVTDIDVGRLQSRDYGYYGKGFYAALTEEGARTYGDVISKFQVSPSARILQAGLKPSDNPLLAEQVSKWRYEKGKERAEAKGRLDDLRWEMDRIKKEPLAFKNAVNAYAEEQGYDIIVYGPWEVVVKNPDRVLTSAEYGRYGQLSLTDLARNVNHQEEAEDPFKQLKKKEKDETQKQLNAQNRDKGLNPSVHEMIDESYSNEDQSEDADLHLGSMTDVIASFNIYEYPREFDTPYTEPVTEPNNTKEYGMGHGPFSEHFEDKTMTSFAMEDFDKDGVGQIDVVPDPNERIENPWFDRDVSIPRG